MPPISAWLELDGSPRYQVIRFQVIAPTRPASTTSSVIVAGSTMPLAIVAATLIETNAPAKLSTAAMRDRRPRRERPRRDARRDRVRGVVEAVREVEEERHDDDGDEGAVHALSPTAFLTTMFAITLAAVSQASSARSSAS